MPRCVICKQRETDLFVNGQAVCIDCDRKHPGPEWGSPATTVRLSGSGPGPETPAEAKHSVSAQHLGEDGVWIIDAAGRSHVTSSECGPCPRLRPAAATRWSPD